ncbi:MAG: 3-keto-5-aminohexanoate cleavage protein [Gemmatimonadetes bacterium]|nr:3-keto-5-aminohexanoate cleavage protein [Gemmatimonadota bacterium]
MSSTNDPTWRYAETFPFLERLESGFPPAILSVSVNGALRGPESSPHIPETVAQITNAVGDAYDAGASIVHLHARDPECLWRGATDPDHWYLLHQQVRARCPDLVIMDSTEGDPGMSFADRTACLDALPEVASLTLAPEMRRSSLPAREGHHPRPAHVTEESVDVRYSELESLASTMRDRGIKPELELKHAGAVQVIHHLIDRGLLDPPYMVQTVLGYPAGNYATVQSALDLLRDLPDESLWLCIGKGRAQLSMTTLALLMGGHVRVGLEDNIFLEAPAHGREGKQGTNAQFVRRAADMVHALQRTVATPAETRDMLGLSPDPRQYP